MASGEATVWRGTTSWWRWGGWSGPLLGRATAMWVRWSVVRGGGGGAVESPTQPLAASAGDASVAGWRLGTQGGEVAREAGAAAGCGWGVAGRRRRRRAHAAAAWRPAVRWARGRTPNPPRGSWARQEGGGDVVVDGGGERGP